MDVEFTPDCGCRLHNTAGNLLEMEPCQYHKDLEEVGRLFRIEPPDVDGSKQRVWDRVFPEAILRTMEEDAKRDGFSTLELPGAADDNVRQGNTLGTTLSSLKRHLHAIYYRVTDKFGYAIRMSDSPIRVRLTRQEALGILLGNREHLMVTRKEVTAE